MLNEKVTVTICGKAYNLRTDNASSLIRQGEEADRRITEYCREMSLSKDDACVFTVLDLLGDLDSANAQRDSYAKKNAALVSTAEKGAKALEENKLLASENELLAKDSAALAELRREHTELEGKNAQLTETLSEANERAAQNASAKTELEKSQQTVKSLEEKNAQLTGSLKSAEEKSEAQKKDIAELERQNSDLKKQAAKLVAVTDENKKLTERLDKAANTEEALRRSEDRVSYLEKECGKLDAANVELNTLKKSLADEQGKTSDLEKKLAAAEKSAAELSEAKQSLAAEKGRNSDLEKKLAAAEKSAAELSEAKQSLAAEKGRNSDLEKKLAAAEKGSEELSGVKKALEAEQGKTADLERRLDVSRRAADDAQNSVSVLEKDIAALKSENEELSALREKAGMYEELTVKFSQIENENAALRAGAGSDASEGAAPAQMEELKKQLSDALAEVKELRKINASLNRQLNEMLEDGQLTL